MNLYKETTEFLEKKGLTWNDVEWVGVEDENCSGAVFGEIPLHKVPEVFNFEYDSGFGSNEVPLSLKVVGKDFWLERREYDGSEWWVFKKLPKKPEVVNQLKSFK